MRTYSIFFIFVIASSLVHSIKAVNYLKNEWKFMLGDNLEYMNNDFDLSKWKPINSGIVWENQGYTEYNGFAWYVQDVQIPENIEKTAIKNGGFNLYLGTIDDADEVYFNGKLIGKTGKFPPVFEGHYDRIRNYSVNPNVVKWGQKNRIAVRVYDGNGDGGLTGKNPYLKVLGEEADVVVSTTFPKKDRIFLSNDNLSFEISVKNNCSFRYNCDLSICVTNDFKDTIKLWNQSIKVNQTKTKLVKANFPKLDAGFYTISITSDNHEYAIDERVNFGVTPEKIISPLNQPNDLEHFWFRAKRELDAVVPQYHLIKIDTLCTNKRDVYLVQMRSLENVLIRGWYSIPKKSGKYPARLLLQGYSTNQQMNNPNNADSAAVFLLNIRGHGNSKDNINPGFPGFLQFNLKDREKYIYRGAFMDCVRAVDFLYSRAEVDTNFIVVEGGSQGGAMSIATAALDNQRIKLCIAAVPFLSDFRDYFKIAFWPANEFTEFVNNNSDFSWDKVFENLSYFDIKNLAPWVKCPVLMSVGLKDTTCPPHINFAAYNQLKSKKEYLVFPENGHSLPADYSIAKYKWMNNEIMNMRVKK